MLNYKILLLVMLTSILTQKSNAQPGGPYFGTTSPLYRAKLQSNAQGEGGMGSLALTGTLLNTCHYCFLIIF